MEEEVQGYFDKLLSRVDGMKAVTVTDRDGVTLIKAITADLPSKLLEPGLSPTFGLVSDRASKLGLGKNKSIVAIFGAYQIVQFNHFPLVTTLIADGDANTGVLLGLGNEIYNVTEVISTAIQERPNIMSP